MSRQSRLGRRRPGSKARSAAAQEVGYRKPPWHSRFRKGQSGNPKGRPRGSQNYATILKKEIDDPVDVVENGKRRKLRKGHVMLRQQVLKAVGGDPKASAQVLELMHRHGFFGTAPSGNAAFAPEQLNTMRAILDLYEILKDDA
jgi:hypothetical protein